MHVTPSLQIRAGAWKGNLEIFRNNSVWIWLSLALFELNRHIYLYGKRVFSDEQICDLVWKEC
jgi:hypothetical protein